MPVLGIFHEYSQQLPAAVLAASSFERASGITVFAGVEDKCHHEFCKSLRVPVGVVLKYIILPVLVSRGDEAPWHGSSSTVPVRPTVLLRVSQGLTPPVTEEECCQALQGSEQCPGIQRLSPAPAPSRVKAGVKRLLQQEPQGPRQVPK